MLNTHRFSCIPLLVISVRWSYSFSIATDFNKSRYIFPSQSSARILLWVPIDVRTAFLITYDTSHDSQLQISQRLYVFAQTFNKQVSCEVFRIANRHPVYTLSTLMKRNRKWKSHRQQTKEANFTVHRWNFVNCVCEDHGTHQLIKLFVVFSQ